MGGVGKGGGVTQRVRQTDTYRDRGIVTDKERKRGRAKETDRQTRQGCVTGKRKRHRRLQNRRLKKNRKKARKFSNCLTGQEEKVNQYNGPLDSRSKTL